MPFTLLDQKSFVSDGNERNIPIPGDCDYFVLKNLDELALAASAGYKWEWYPDLADGEADYHFKAGADVVSNSLLATGGFIFRKNRPEPEAAVTATAVTAANPASVAAVAHGYASGDRVRMYGTTDMRQIASMDFTVTRVDADNFELKNLDASGFAAPATAGLARRLPSLGEVVPEALFITSVTQAAQAVMTTSVDHTYQVGQLLYLSVPSAFGMVELDGLTAKVLARTASSVTLDVNSQAFTPFAFPPSTVRPTDFAMVGPAGQRNSYNVDDVPFHSGQFYPYMHLGPDLVGSNGNRYVWQAWKGEN